jgi:hypothetical protein
MITFLKTRAPASLAGLVSVAALAAATTLALPLAAQAQATTVRSHHQTAEQARETVEMRISNLHTLLMITPAQEDAWTAVAQAMRHNERVMIKLQADKNAEPVHQITAIEDMRTYEAFNEAHVEGVKNLMSAFEGLYNAMPPSQQAIADQAFRDFGHKSATAG